MSVPVTAQAWPVVGSFAAVAGTLVLARYVFRYRERPGATWFLGVLFAQSVWCSAYGAALLTFDPTLRVALEGLAWIGTVWTGLAFLAFALEYTGRGGLVYGPAFGSATVLGVVATLLVVTNPLHGAMWTGFRIDPILGVATATYALGPAAYLTVGGATLAVTVGVVLLVDTFLNYGPLYRRETAAVAVSALPPGFALLAWTAGVGPIPRLNLAPVMFVPHVVLDAYAFGRAELFERDPTTVRAAERTAVDDLADPILVVDRDRRIVRCNAAARAAFVDDAGGDDPGTDGDPGAVDVLDRSIDDVLGTELDIDDAADPFEHRTAGERRTYAVSSSPLRDPAGTHVGWTVVCSDVTERERRRQQLEVLNRVLRHNLRNDAGVVHGYADLLVDRLDDGATREMADAIERRSAALAALGDKARTVESLIDGEEPRPVAVGATLDDAVADVREAEPDADIALDVRTDVTVPMAKHALVAAVENLLENAVRHHDGAGAERSDGTPWALITADRADGAVIVQVVDDGPGIPDAEREAIEAGGETALRHGSGLGLWIVHWAAATLGADVTYADREPRGTVATLRIPIAEG